MRKTLQLLCAAALVVAIASPAQAIGEQGKQCNTYHNAAGGKSLKFCGSTVENNTGVWNYWGRAELDKVTGDQMPYALVVRHLIMWSKVNGGTNWCEGDYPSCNGAGNGGGLVITPSDGQQLNTDHYSSSEHLCLVHTEVSVTIYWTQTQYANLDGDNKSAFNSDNYNTAPNCVGT